MDNKKIEDNIITNQNQKIDETLTIDDLFKFHIDKIDKVEPISLTEIWDDINDQKVILLPREDYDKIKFYYENNKIIRCFTIETLTKMKVFNHLNQFYELKHPISFKPIPLFMFDNIQITVDQISVAELANNVLNNILDDYKPDYTLFLLLNKSKLIKLNFELFEFWNKNMDLNQRNEIYSTAFNKNHIEFTEMCVEEIQLYILNEIKFLCDWRSANNSIGLVPDVPNYMIGLIIIGGIGEIIKEYRSEFIEYSDFNVDNESYNNNL